jgi:endonuclease-3 related protein
VPRRSTLQKILTRLAATQGEIDDGPPRDPWHAILWDNVVYLTDEARRQQAFAQLRKATGLEAGIIAAAPDEVLLPICGKGKMAAQQVAKLRECAELFSSAGNPRSLVKLPEAEARKGLCEFPGVGLPGFHRLRLFAGTEPRATFESNGLRALARLGFGEEQKDYAATYRVVTAAVDAELPEDVEVRIDAWQRLRRHGQQTCRRQPMCDGCPVANLCAARRGDMH